MCPTVGQLDTNRHLRPPRTRPLIVGAYAHISDGWLAADLADVLSTLHVAGPLTLAGHWMGAHDGPRYLGRPADDRPVEPSGLVLIATAAGKLIKRGIGRPDLHTCHRIAIRHRRARTQIRHAARNQDHHEIAQRCPADHTGTRSTARTALTALPTNSLTTAAGFLLGLKRYDRYDTLAVDRRQGGGGQRRNGLTPTPASRANDRAATISRCRAHAHSVPRGTCFMQRGTAHSGQRRNQPRALRNKTARRADSRRPRSDRRAPRTLVGVD